MAGRDDTKKQIVRFGSTIIYYVAVLFLIVLIVIMYQKWRETKKQYAVLVQEASLQDQAYAIELQKDRDRDLEDELPEESTVSPETDQ